jgi:hypothetical protein
MADEARVSVDFIRTISERDSDIRASLDLRKGWMEKDANRIGPCMSCGSVLDAKFMAHVGMNAWKCIRCMLGRNSIVRKK